MAPPVTVHFKEASPPAAAARRLAATAADAPVRGVPVPRAHLHEPLACAGWVRALHAPLPPLAPCSASVYYARKARCLEASSLI